MNYAGKFDAALSLDGQGLHSPASDHIDSFTAESFTAKAHGHVPQGAVVIEDPNLIFHGDFKRTGLDLVLSHDGHEFVVHDYFKGDKRASIASPDGAHLTGDIVSALTGYVQVAQAGPGAAAAEVIGHVTKLTGSATAIRNGVSVILNNGDNVEKGDVVSTGSDSTLGVTFIDGTVFGLSSNARMVLNEMVYDPNGSNNSSLLSLVAGTITFVAGETAKHGDMKIDTPVATMGIRGTAVLTEINFVVPSGGGDPQPQANFQVLVEPNGTTGSYILFDKLTLLPIATVNQAGQMIQISGGNVSVTNALLSPDVQKLITDVFTLKFTDNGTNTKLTTNFTDSITQTGNTVLITTPDGAKAQATFTNTGNTGNSGPAQSGTQGSDRVTGPPKAASLDASGNVTTSFSGTEQADATADRSYKPGHIGDAVGSDTVIFKVNFVDQNLGDRPTVSVALDASNYTYTDSLHHDVTASLTALQRQDIAAAQVKITVAADGGNNNNGSSTLTYSVADHVFDFLGAGETLTLTYIVSVDNNYSVDREATTFPITITITGTNDQPVITTSVPTITFAGGTKTEGGPLTTDVPTSGKLTFTDVDLTDTHTVSKAFTAVLPGGVVPTTIKDFLENAMTFSIAAGDDSTGTGTGTIDWSLAPIPVYLADFIPKGDVLTLTYTVTVTDSHGATSQQTITVTITGTESPAVVWIETTQTGSPPGGLWSTGANWETGVAPTIDDDVIVITNQLMGLNPSYPVTIDAPAYAKSLSMNDFDTDRSSKHVAPQVNNQSSLTIAGTLKLEADSVFDNFAAGTVSVGSKVEILDEGVLKNAGYLTLAGGGDFAVGTSITNSGTIELSGGTLTTLAGINNAGGIIKVDAGPLTKLIVDTVTIDGGTLTILGTLELKGTSLIENGTLNNSGAVNVEGAVEFANETVGNSSLGKIEVFADATLTVDKSSIVNNAGNVTVDANGKVIVNGATIDGGVTTGGTVPWGGGGETTDRAFIDLPPRSVVTGTVTNNGELDLTGDAVLSNGFLKNNGTLDASGSGNALNGEKVTNAGTIEVLTGALAIGPGSTVDNSSGNVIVDADAALTLSGATISGGTVDGDGNIDVTGASTINSGATLSVATVTADAQLTLDGITVSGSTITDNASIELDSTVKLQDGAEIKGGPVTNNGTLEVAGPATLLNDVVTNNGTVKVDGSQTLTVSGTEISGGAINGTGTIDVTGNSKVDGGATLSTSAVTVEAGTTLTLDTATVDGTTISDKGSITVDGTVKLTGGAVIKGSSSAFDSKGGTPATMEFNWGQLGTSFTQLSSPQQVVAADGSGSTVSSAGGVFQLRDQGYGWGGNFAAGTHLLWDEGAGPDITIKFAVPVISAGAQIQADSYGSFSAEIIAYDLGGNVIGTVNKGGVSTGIGDGSAIFIGLVSSSADIASVKFVLTSAAWSIADFAVGPVQFTESTSGPIVNNGTLEIEGPATLLDDFVTNHGTVSVDLNQTLTLSGTEISGGSIAGAGTIDVTGSSAIDGGATLNTSFVTVESLQSLMLDAMTVDGATITDKGSIDLDDTVKLQGGATIKGTSADAKGVVTNNGTLEIAGGATLLNDVVTNTGTVQVDSDQTLTLSGTEIIGGTIDGTGTIDVTVGSKIDGGATLSTSAVIADDKLTLDGITVSGSVITDNASVELDDTVKLQGGAEIKGGPVTNNGTLEIAGAATLLNDVVTNKGTVQVDGDQTLTLSGTEVTGGTINGMGTIDVTVASKIDGGATLSTSTVIADDKLTLDGITVSGSVITDNASIDLDDTVKLQDGAEIKGGPVTNNGTLEIAGAATLLNDVVTNKGTVTADSDQTLTLSGTEISGGTINGAGTIDVTVASKIDGGATLSTSAVIADDKLTLDGITVSGSVITDNASIELDDTVKLQGGAEIKGGPVTNNDTLEIAGAATLLNDVVTNKGAVQVDSDQTLTLSGTEISGGTISGTGAIDVTVASKIDGGATLSTSTVIADDKLTLDGITVSGSAITDNASIELDDTVKLQGGATIQGTSADAKGAVTNNGTLEVAGAATLLYDVVTNTGTVQVDGSQILTLAGTEISGGTINGTGEIDVAGASTIDGGATLSTSTVIAGAKLTLDGITVSGSTITDYASIELDDTVKLQDGATIQGTSANLKAPITNNGTLEIAGAATLLYDVVTNTGTVQVDVSQILTLAGTEISGGTINGTGEIDVAGASTIDGGATLSTSTVIAGAKLTLDGITVSGSVITDNSSVELDDTVKLQGGATIQGASADAKGAVTNNGTLEIAGAATLLNDVVTNKGTVQVDDGKTLTLSGTEISGGTINNFSGLSGGTISVTGDSTIDNSATLNNGAVTVASDVTLTFGDATVSASKVTNSGTVKVEADKKLTLAGAALTGGALTIAGTLTSSGTTTITDANISNLSLLESTLGGVLTLAATTSTPVITNDGGTIRANNAELDINTEAVTNTGTLAAINDGTLKLISTKVTNSGGGVSVEAGSTLDLSDATVNGGTLTISGTLESTGTSAITSADITNTGTITVTSGTLTIDPADLHTLTNNKLLQANGGELDFAGEAIVNTADIKAIGGGILKLSNLDVTNDGGTVTVDGTSKLYLTAASINGGSLNNSGNLYSVSGLNTISAGITSTGTIEVQAGTLNLSGGLAGAGALVIDDGATLELAGATAQTVTFAGGADTLQLDKVVGESFTGTITGQSSKDGTFTITGAADITASSGDALDFTASGGTSIKPANIVLTPTGALQGAANGIVVTHDGTGDISLTATGNITGLAGNGIALTDSATGSGDVTVDDLTGMASGTGAGTTGVLAVNLNAANGGNISITQKGGASGGDLGIDGTTHGNGDVTIDAGGNITGSAVYGIRARSYGTGSETVTTEAGSVISSGSSGIVAVNRATSLAASDSSTITVNAYGTINSGASLNQSGNAPAGIQAGYAGATTGTAANTAVNGTVVVNNYADITAAGGRGIDAYNYGNGDVTVNDGAGTTVVGAAFGIKALGLSGGSGDVAVNVGANAHVTGTSTYGIDAYSINAGSVSLTMADGDVVKSGSTGVGAINEATAIASGVHSTIFVSAHGSIHSGSTNTQSGHLPAGVMAGYTAGGQNGSAVYGNVTVDSDATIVADAGFGIEAFTSGVGNVTVTTGVSSSITAAGTAIFTFDQHGGDISITNDGSATGAIGIAASANGAGKVSITNDGDVTATSGAGISVAQAVNGTGLTHIINESDGYIVGGNGAAAIFIHSANGASVLIDNSGTIGPSDPTTVTSTTSAIVETGGPVTINNSGDINGNISVANATFNNELGGTWTVSGTSVFGASSSIDNAGEIDLHGSASISGAGGAPFGITNSGEIESWGSNAINGSITNTGTVEARAGTLNLSRGLAGAGALIIDDGATLELAGATAQTVTFAGGADTLQLDKVAGQSFTGTITGQSSKDGTFTVTGAADITVALGDALDFTASGGTSIKPANIVLTMTGNIGSLFGNGITLRDSASGVGNITIDNVTGIATGIGPNSEGILVGNLNAANAGDISVTQLGGAAGDAFGIDATTHGDGDVTIDAGGNITGSSIYAIRARSYGTGDINVTTEAGSVVTSGSSGIVAVNRATSIDASDNSTITVNAHGSINSGSSLNQGGNPPAGIQAGYTGATSGTSGNTAVNGTVVVNNYADITAAAGSGIDAYNYGNGDVTVNSFAGTTISVAGTQSYGIEASALSGGTGDIAVTLGANVTISGATAYGIKAYSVDAGDISVTVVKGDSITSGSSGIVAVNYATSIDSDLDSTISVKANGTIHSGSTSNNDGSTPGAIIAGYKPGGNATFSGAVNGDVTVDSDATITADKGYGIEAFTWGAGDVTVTTGGTSSITAAGTAIGAFDHGGGDVSVTNEGSATGAVGLAAFANGTGDVTIVNDGHLTGTSSVGISVTQNAVGAAGSTHITNDGSIVGADGHAAIYIQENAIGTALIDNSGTIGPADATTVVSTTYAIVETGGVITINNTGEINGNIAVASATFNNELGGTWTVSGTGVFGTLSTIDNAGEIDLHGASVSSADGLSFGITNSGEIESWGTSSITGNITNTDTIEVHADGTLSLFGSLSGSGSVTIDTGATLVVDATVSQTVTFNGDGSELSIQTTDFGGSIAGLATTDKIDLSSIDYGLGTSAVYVANENASTGGTLTITDAEGHHINLSLTGADYSNAVFAGSDDGTGHTLITVNTADDAPKFTTDGATLTASFSELANTTNSPVLDPSPAATGAIAFSDVDLTDRPTAKITHQDVTWLDSDHATQLTLTPDEISALETAISLQQSGKNSGTVGWSYSIADSTLDFLAKGQTAMVVSTITLDDGHHTDTTHVTVTISGANDAPTLDGATLGAVSEDTAAPAGSTVGQLFTAGFHDVDNHSSLSAVAITADHATADQGVWQYEVAGSNQWIDISGVSDTGALVLATDTLLRFVPAANYSGVPGSLDVHALDDTYGGGVSGDTPVLIDITSSAIGSSVSAQPATLNTEVTPVADPPAFTGRAVNYVADSLTGNTIDTTKWHVVLPSVPGTADDASVTPTANGVVLHDHGYLETTSGFTPTAATPLHVGLSFSLDDGIGPYVAVTDGTDGTTGAYGSPVNGLSFMFGWGHGLIITNNATGDTVNLSAGLSQGTVYDASITDDGSHQTVVIVNHSTGETVGTYTSDFSDYAAGNLVTITNREANDSQHDATVSNVTISNAYEGDHGTPIALSGLTAVTDTDGSEHMSLDLSGFPEGATFSVGQPGTGAVAGHWLIGSSDIAALGGSPLTMTAPADYTGEFSLHVSGTVVDQATGLGGPLSDTKTFTSDVAVKVDGSAPEGGPVIDTDSFNVAHNRDLGTDTIYNLSVKDIDSSAATDSFTVTAVTAHPPAGEDSPGSAVVPASVSGSLDQINTDFAKGVTYVSGNPAPDQDQITLTVTDKTTGLSDTVHFIFNEAGDTSQGITLTGTAGKDVIFSASTNDTLSGGGGKDQFVFSPNGSGNDGSHTITDFIEGLDKIDLRQFSDVSSVKDLTIAQQSGDTLVTWNHLISQNGDPVTEHEQILLKGVTTALQTSDFIFGTHIA